MKTMDWDEIEPIIKRFYVWQDQPEKPWFQKAWKSLHQAGLATYDTDIDCHWVIVRAVALGVMYNDYCELEWNEYSDPSGCISELFWEEKINHLRIGAMATDWIDPNDDDAHSLFTDAILGLVSEVRLPVYDALLAGSGDTVLLYTGLWGSRSEDTDQGNLEPIADSLFDESGFLLKGNPAAFDYVNVASMIAKDA